MNSTECVLFDLVAERERQDKKWGQQNHPSGTGAERVTDGGEVKRDPVLAEVRRERANEAKEACEVAAREHRVTWRHILHEEVAEALAEDDPDLLRRELVQVAAVAVNWIECIDRRRVWARESKEG